MCIIAAKPSGVSLLPEVVESMWYNNDDGAGFMYAENGKLYVEKGFMTLDDFLQAYEPHKERSMVLHFRIRTHGRTDATMTHPFVIDDNLAFAHNGIISGLGDEKHSDTWYFNEDYLKKLRSKIQNFLDIDVITNLIENKIGYSKLVFMDNEGNIKILNENKGNYSSDGIWFSNDSWKTRKNLVQPIANVVPSIPYYKRNVYQTDPYFGIEYEDDPVVPFQSYPTRKRGSFEPGDFFILSNDVYTARLFDGSDIDGVQEKMDKGDMFRVLSLGAHDSIYAYSTKHKQRVKFWTTSFMEKVTIEGSLTKHWGHLRPKDKVLIIDFDAKFCSCIDPNLGRKYKIPTNRVNIFAPS